MVIDMLFVWETELMPSSKDFVCHKTSLFIIIWKHCLLVAVSITIRREVLKFSRDFFGVRPSAIELIVCMKEMLVLAFVSFFEISTNKGLQCIPKTSFSPVCSYTHFYQIIVAEKVMLADVELISMSAWKQQTLIYLPFRSPFVDIILARIEAEIMTSQCVDN